MAGSKFVLRHIEEEKINAKSTCIISLLQFLNFRLESGSEMW